MSVQHSTPQGRGRDRGTRRGGEGALTRGGFYKVLIMYMFLPRFPELLSPLASGGLRQDNARRIGVSRQRRHGGPGFWHQAALRQRLLAQQRHQQPHPDLPNDRDQPTAPRPPA